MKRTNLLNLTVDVEPQYGATPRVNGHLVCYVGGQDNGGNYPRLAQLSERVDVCGRGRVLCPPFQDGVVVWREQRDRICKELRID